MFSCVLPRRVAESIRNEYVEFPRLACIEVLLLQFALMLLDSDYVSTSTVSTVFSKSVYYNAAITKTGAPYKMTTVAS